MLKLSIDSKGYGVKNLTFYVLDQDYYIGEIGWLVLVDIEITVFSSFKSTIQERN